MTAGPVTQLLRRWSQGEAGAANELTPLVYPELRRLASSYMRRERPDHTPAPTALAPQAYLAEVGQGQPEWKSRSHFFSFAAHLMRQILVDHARERQAEKRGGEARRLPIEAAQATVGGVRVDVLALDEALTKLAAFDERKARVLELRFF